MRLGLIVLFAVTLERNCDAFPVFGNNASLKGYNVDDSMFPMVTLLVSGWESYRTQSKCAGCQRQQMTKIALMRSSVQSDRESYSKIKNDADLIVRKADEKDLAAVSKVLTDVFYGDTTNFFTYPLEWLNLYLELNSRYQTFRFAERTGARYGIFVACLQGTIVGCCEVDDAEPKGEVDPAPRPYMCNLAVLVNARRKGVAYSLISQCENLVRDQWGASKLYLKMKEGNTAAFGLYTGLGYNSVESKYVESMKERVLLLTKQLRPPPE